MGADLAASGGLPKMPGLDPAAVAAIRATWPGKLLGRLSALLAGIALVLGFIALVAFGLVRLGIAAPPWLLVVLIGGATSVIIAQLINEWRAERNRVVAERLARKPISVPTEYFRIGPFLETEDDQKHFHRADLAHKKALEWILNSTIASLYLTGDSGSGKSSLLNAFVVPALRKREWTVLTTRASEDVEAALARVLTPPSRSQAASPKTSRELIEAAARRAQIRLLVILDQFEEFIILGTRERQRAFAALISDLVSKPVKGLTILIVLRSDYQTALSEMELPKLLQGENFFQVGRFRDAAARAFLKPLGLKDETLDKLLKSASELDDTPGMVRPITLNVLGHILSQAGPVASSMDAGTLVREYLTQTVENPAIRNWSRSVIEGLLTGQGTKRPRREVDLCEESNLRPGEVRAVLNAMVDNGLARPLDQEQGVWELSHDFIARAFARYLGGLRRRILRQVVFYSAPTLLALNLLIVASAVSWGDFSSLRYRDELGQLGITIRSSDDGLMAESNANLKEKNLAEIRFLLSKLSGSRALTSLTLENTPTSIDFSALLKELPALRKLKLTNVSDLSPLSHLTKLKFLSVSGTVSDLSPLSHLTALNGLDVGATRVSDLSPLSHLTKLVCLDVFRTRVSELSPLSHLTALKVLDVGATQVSDLSPLSHLTALTGLGANNTGVSDLSPLSRLTALTFLRVSSTGVSDLSPLSHLTKLTSLNAKNTRVSDLSPLLQETALKNLYVGGTQVSDLSPLKGLTALTELDVSDTQVSDPSPLKGLTALTDFDVSGTQVDLSPLKGLDALTNLKAIRIPNDTLNCFLKEFPTG